MAHKGHKPAVRRLDPKGSLTCVQERTVCREYQIICNIFNRESVVQHSCIGIPELDRLVVRARSDELAVG